MARQPCRRLRMEIAQRRVRDEQEAYRYVVPVACVVYLVGLRILQALPPEDLVVLIAICKSLPKPLE
jgi:hypothetical protein